MFAVLWENTSPYFLLTVLLSIFCLLLTFLFRAANSSQSEDEVPRVEGSNVKSLVQAKPLLLAKELENNLPEHVKVLEKRVESEQLEAILRLMQENSDHFGSTTMDEMKDQLHLYGL